MIQFTLNGKLVQTNDEPDTPLLWVIRDSFKLTGSKFGCGMAQCGACTMHVDGRAQRSCVLPVAAVAGKSITTIEGLGTPDNLHPLQQAWVDQGVPQCGYCQSGQIMSAASLLSDNPNPSEAQVESAMAGNICRCGCYPRIKKAILTVAEQSQPGAVQVAIPVTSSDAEGVQS
ncbi:(2Fe-2S)-binding protein [Porticoccaceae bacterium]|jgi:isoquinoline 1-oxidoreductase alpha subunit|nr:(2Fe-2S)-binding protein [Porticoccaceae bacterium]MDA8936330.1 (2Fe-2S)-binding protein [Porticoccaceae bacterium]MDA9559479.1 (2Fe-2S)-binding protein [Porticoccaceae bacterium]MDB2549190.1 (2Fe-2S)-binding protein [Porticoccaceae bacterium]